MALGRTNINLTEIPVGYEQIVNYAMLYDSGVESDIGDGWSKGVDGGGDGLGTVTKNATNVYFYGNGSKDQCPLSTVSKISFDGTYNKVFARFNNISASNNAHRVRIWIDSTRTIWSSTQVASVSSASGEIISLSEKILNVDVSGISGSYYITVGAVILSDSAGYMTAYMTHTFMTKADDWTTLASKAGITASSIADILSVSSTLLAHKDAVNFMVAQCTGDFMASAIASETFITALNSSPYKSIVQGNEHWAKFLAMVA